MKWNVLNQNIPQSIEELQKTLLENLGLSAKEEKKFFHPTHPLKVSLTEAGLDEKKVKKAVQRILKAKENQEEVIIFGDYDADGVCATAILWETLFELGLKVRPFIPHREKHGYGLSMRALKDLLKEHHPDLIITVDNGIVAHKQAEHLKEQGIELIITDHHQQEEKLPPAVGIVHSTAVCGAGVSWFLSREVMLSAGKKLDENWQLDLAAIATIGDQMPLLQTNRSFAHHGIKALQKTNRPGLKALFKQAQVKQKEITAQSIGFRIGPRINAMGRLEHSLEALRLLVARKKTTAHKLASLLGETNSQRQSLTSEMYQQALSMAKSQEKEKLLIVHEPDFHEGVVGLIAGRLTEKFYKPSIALSSSQGIAKASARSVSGVNIVELIRQVRDDLIEVGGHPMAAGFAVEIEKLEMVIKKLQALAQESISAKKLEPSLEIASYIPSDLLNEKTVKMITEFAPFGQANPEPVLGIKKAQVLSVFTMGQENQHLKVVVKIDDQMKPLNCLWWRHGYLAEKLSTGMEIDLAGVLELNHWRGKTSVQMRVEDILFP